MISKLRRPWIALSLAALGSSFVGVAVASQDGVGRSDLEPEESAVGLYKATDGGQVEVVGICKVGEGTVSCWTNSGDKNPTLEAQVKPVLERQGMPPFKSPGKKNRLIVFKSSQPTYKIAYALERVGGARPVHAGLFGMPAPEQRGRWFGAWLAADVNAKATNAEIRKITLLDEQTRFKTSAGTTFDYAGAKVRVKELKEVTKTTPIKLERDQRLWQLTLESSDTAARGLDLILSGLNRAGDVFERADEKGNPLTDKERNRMIEERERKIRQHEPVLFPNPLHALSAREAVQGPIERKGNQRVYLVNVNPSKIDKFQARGNKSTFIEFKDIKLDPK